MKLELKENMYVRTKDGISQYKYYDTSNGKLLCIPVKDGSRGIFANIEDIIKASFNIIDILECGDYVNGREVVDIFYDVNDNVMDVCVLGSIVYDNNEIKSIVTKEQFEQMTYKVGE